MDTLKVFQYVIKGVLNNIKSFGFHWKEYLCVLHNLKGRHKGLADIC
jgi:hypothetical protein